MYKKSTEGLLKHKDFIFLDVLCLELSFILSFYIRNGGLRGFAQPLYRNMFFILFFVQLMVALFFEPFKNVLKRGYYKEFVETVKNVLLISLISAAYLFVIKQSGNFSRFVMINTAVIYLISSYITRLLFKQYFHRKKYESEGTRSLLVISSSKEIENVLRRIQEHNFERFNITGIVLTDKNQVGMKIKGIPVVADTETVLEYVCREWVDEVFFTVSDETDFKENWLEQFMSMGITVHLNLAQLEAYGGYKQTVEKLSSYPVVTYSINYASSRSLVAKRILDIVGGIVGCLMTVLITIIIGPIIYKQSPGPIFFSQERIGKNGKKFKCYKFRSMYMDAEERKKELMKQNRVKDGLMFKMENDPRIIGSEKGPGKGIGNFIRKTSLDEFPQFWNVLKGDMSLVGTRPPTVDEWEKYEFHHRSRLATKPGITGMWQVSGRSEITDFEEVVKLDRQYITNWTFGMDIKILLKTVSAVLKHEGSM